MGMCNSCHLGVLLNFFCPVCGTEAVLGCSGLKAPLSNLSLRTISVEHLGDKSLEPTLAKQFHTLVALPSSERSLRFERPKKPSHQNIKQPPNSQARDISYVGFDVYVGVPLFMEATI